jgi:hypothetical protein
MLTMSEATKRDGSAVEAVGRAMRMHKVQTVLECAAGVLCWLAAYALTH